MNNKTIATTYKCGECGERKQGKEMAYTGRHPECLDCNDSRLQKEWQEERCICCGVSMEDEPDHEEGGKVCVEYQKSEQAYQNSCFDVDRRESEIAEEGGGY